MCELEDVSIGVLLFPVLSALNKCAVYFEFTAGVEKVRVKVDACERMFTPSDALKVTVPVDAFDPT